MSTYSSIHPPVWIFFLPTLSACYFNFINIIYTNTKTTVGSTVSAIPLCKIGCVAPNCQWFLRNLMRIDVNSTRISNVFQCNCTLCLRRCQSFQALVYGERVVEFYVYLYLWQSCCFYIHTYIKQFYSLVPIHIGMIALLHFPL